MGNGFPVAAVLIAPSYQAKHGLLGTTFGGNYLACAAAISVLDVIKEEGLIENAKTTGEYFINQLMNFEGVKEVRGIGLMIGIELREPCAGIRNRLLNEHRIFTGSASNKNTLRILPPLTLSRKEVDIFLEAFSQVLKTQPVV